MENLTSEKVINKNEKNKINIDNEIKEEIIKAKDEDQNNINKSLAENNENENENNKKGELSTDFVEKIELTEEEKNLRNNYLKKVTRKEALIRSIILGKNTYFMRIFNFITNIIYNIISIKETKYKSDAINAITEKDLDKFIIS